MDLDWGSAMGGAAAGASTGAEIGTLLGPGIGNVAGGVVGGVAGGLVGLFTQKDQAPTYQNPYLAQQQSQINTLMSSNIGAQSAAHESAGYQEESRDTFGKMMGNPVNQNPAIAAALFNKMSRTSASQSQSANLRGSEQDLQSHSLGAKMQQGLSDQQFDIGKYNTQIGQQNRQPGFFQQLLMSGMSQGFGSSMGSLFGKQPSTGTPGLPSGMQIPALDTGGIDLAAQGAKQWGAMGAPH